MKEEKLYLETLKEIRDMKEYVKDEIDSLFVELQKLRDMRGAIEELQEEVAKLAGEPVGMLFTNYWA
tara:strand:- start:275 stop:475 length:201 start_codon:yes stop_codon:yes gene_type:complete